MSGPNRTFVLQAAAVAVIAGFVVFAFLRQSDPDLAGIQAPGENGPSFETPPSIQDGRDNQRRAAVRSERRPQDGIEAAPTAGTLRNGAGVAGGARAGSTFGAGPADDQYTDTASALMARARGSGAESGR